MTETLFASFSPIGIIIFILYTIYSVAKANKKNKEKQAKKSGRTQPQQSAPIPNQPGKSIDDILRELERRASGKNNPPPIPEVQKTVKVEKPKREKTVKEYKEEIHSGMAKHHVTKEQLTDGKFDEIDHKLMHLEEFEVDAHPANEDARYDVEDIRRAIIWQTILERPYAD